MAFNQKYFNLIKKLLPKSKLWKLIDTKYLNKFFRALTALPDDLRKYIDNIYLDLFPESTRSLELWENQYGIINPDKSEETRRNAIAMRWKDKGGQSAYYMQSILQGNGFNVLVHENNPVANPNDFLDNDDKENQVIVNGFIPRVTEIKILLVECETETKDLLIQCAEEDFNFICNKDTEDKAVCGYFENYIETEFEYDIQSAKEGVWACNGDRAVCGYFENYIEIDSEEDIPTEKQYFPFCFFIGGEATRDESGKIIALKPATIQADRLDYFRRLVLNIKPAHSWAILRFKLKL